MPLADPEFAVRFHPKRSGWVPFVTQLLEFRDDRMKFEGRCDLRDIDLPSVHKCSVFRNGERKLYLLEITSVQKIKVDAPEDAVPSYVVDLEFVRLV